MALTPEQESRLIASCNGAQAEIRAIKAALGSLQQAKSAASALTPLVPRFIEDIPGKRVPYTYGVNITITNTTQTPGTITISSINAITADGAGSLIALPDSVDFLWNYSEAGSDRARQNIDRSSVELFSNQDRPCYLPIADFFERNTAVTVNVTMLRNPTNTGVLYFGFCGYKLLQPIAFAG